MNVGALDLGILIVYLAGVVGFGLWIGRGTKTAAEYMVAGRDLPWWLILASIIATETSTVTFLSIPGFAFDRDLTWMQIAIGFLIGRIVVAFLFLPQYFRGTLFTAYQVLETRFGETTQRAASTLFLITRTLGDGLRLFLSGLVLQEMTGIALPWAVVGLGLATILYCAVGGLKAVLWTDLVQLVIYVGGAVIALFLIIDRLPGGWDQLLAIGEANGKLRWVDLSFDPAEPYALWAGLIGGLFITLGSHGVDQMLVQRYLCARSLGDARRAVWSSGVAIVAQFGLFLLIGVALFAFYEVFPPEAAFDRSDRVFARFILTEMPIGVKGVLLGALFAAAMSTLSSSLNSCATAAANDLYFPAVDRGASSEKRLRITKIFTIGFGLLQIVVGIASQWVTGSVVSSVLGIAGFTTGIVLGVFFLGMFAGRVGQRAALAGLVIGLAGMSWVFFATDIAWPWYALLGSAGTLVAGLAASLVWPREPVETVDA